MAQRADIQYISPSLQSVDINSPTRIWLHMPLSALPLVYTDKYSTVPPPREDFIYVENPAALELARQVYASLFRKDVTITELRPLLRLAHFTSDHKLGDPSTQPLLWTDYEMAFDHLVPTQDQDPEVIILAARNGEKDNAINIKDVTNQDLRKSLNETILDMGGKLGETSADGRVTFWP